MWSPRVREGDRSCDTQAGGHMPAGAGGRFAETAPGGRRAGHRSRPREVSTGARAWGSHSLASRCRPDAAAGCGQVHRPVCTSQGRDRSRSRGLSPIGGVGFHPLGVPVCAPWAGPAGRCNMRSAAGGREFLGRTGLSEWSNSGTRDRQSFSDRPRNSSCRAPEPRGLLPTGTGLSGHSHVASVAGGLLGLSFLPCRIQAGPCRCFAARPPCCARPASFAHGTHTWGRDPGLVSGPGILVFTPEEAQSAQGPREHARIQDWGGKQVPRVCPPGGRLRESPAGRACRGRPEGGELGACSLLLRRRPRSVPFYHGDALYGAGSHFVRAAPFRSWRLGDVMRRSPAAG